MIGKSNTLMCLLRRASSDVQEEEKDLDDINIERKRSEHILLGADAVRSGSDQQLSVVGQKLKTHASFSTALGQPVRTAIE